MKAFVSIYVDLKDLDLTPEQLFLLDEYLEGLSNSVYEDIRNRLTLTPANYGHRTKVKHGIKDGREKVAPPKKAKTPAKKAPVDPVEAE